MKHRPHLDGLRGIAISLVLLQHLASVHPAKSGAIGVSLFFALSGYLITGLLIDEYERTGQVRIALFYGRRAVRLVPALFVMVAVTAPLLARESIVVWRPVIAALTYTTNIAEITGWAHGAPYLQTWTLGIEEHFYLLWAPVLLRTLRRGDVRDLLNVALIGAGLSIMWNLILTCLINNTGWADLGSFSMGNTLLLGCAIAAAARLGWMPSRWLLVVGIAGFIYLNAWPYGSKVWFLQGSVWPSICSAAVVAGLHRDTGRIPRLLGLKPIAWVGTISYSLYLWHFPLLSAYAGRLRLRDIFILSVVAATASYYLVERPARSVGRRWLDRMAARDTSLPNAAEGRAAETALNFNAPH